MHSRSPRIFANLHTGFSLFLDFATRVEAITVDQSVVLLDTLRASLQTLILQHGLNFEGIRPTELYLKALNSLFSGGRIVFAEVLHPLFTNPNSRAIGWQDSEYIYLHPDLAWEAVTQFYQRNWPYQQNQLNKFLAEEGIVIREDKRHILYGKKLGGAEERVLRIPRKHFTAIPNAEAVEEGNGVALDYFN
jgi:hypothetical protein